MAERTPFRLTHNMVDALGVTGVDGESHPPIAPLLWLLNTKPDSDLQNMYPIGVYRRAAEIALTTLRTNRDSLTSVLEAFVHDPLVEWEELKRKHEVRRWPVQFSVPLFLDFQLGSLTTFRARLAPSFTTGSRTAKGRPTQGRPPNVCKQRSDTDKR